MGEVLMRDEIQDLKLLSSIPPNRISDVIVSLKKHFPFIFAFDSPERLFPLDVSQDSTGRKYICCDANRYMGSTRSPWNNAFLPHISDAPLPKEQHRYLEERLNYALVHYASSYYNHQPITSVYCLSRDVGVIVCCLIKSPHIEIAYLIDVNEKFISSINYSLSVVYSIKLTEQEFVDKDMGNLCFSLYFRHRRSKEIKVSSTNLTESHIRNIGRLIEKVDSDVFGKLRAVYPIQTRLILQELRTDKSTLPPKQTIAFKEELAAALTSRGDS
ncbi:unnamed protein product [Rodentolepis nana]|uniref:F-actin-capping protein subunit beta n=1 Tax=Rodentolepis nana TaxID=102285 RepID=A0A0R3TMH0_RODNA|nr:unnamed protein product [Rodentolepis nana]